MNYPKLKCEDKNNTKVCSLISRKMKDMRKENHTYQEIADKFKVSQRTAWIYTAPPKLVFDSKEQRKIATRKEHSEKYTKNSKYRKKLIHSVNIFKRKRYSNDIQYRKYTIKLNSNYKLRLQKKHSI